MEKKNQLMTVISKKSPNLKKALDYAEWLHQLNLICLMELCVEWSDLPDVPTRQSYEDAIKPQAAFNAYCADQWQDYIQLETSEYTTEIDETSDADPGL